MTTAHEPQTGTGRADGGAGSGGDPGGADPAEEGPVRPDNLVVGLLKLARPRQWSKNLLVFAAPGAAGVLTEQVALLETVAAFVCFCLAAAGTYYVNDARDVEADRLHPRKRHRPVATGSVPLAVAYGAGALLLLAAIALSLLVDVQLTATVGAYVVLTTAYSNLLKDIAVVDVVTVASGFVLRAVAGAAATDIPISDWFFIVTVFGSLFMVSGKRGAEAAEMGDDATRFRSVLATYTSTYNAYLRSVTSSAMLVGYCLWAVEKADSVGLSASEHPWYQISVLPFVMGVLRYALVLDQGRGSAPEDIVLNDRALQLIGLAWVVVFGIGVYTA